MQETKENVIKVNSNPCSPITVFQPCRLQDYLIQSQRAEISDEKKQFLARVSTGQHEVVALRTDTSDQLCDTG